MSTIRQELRVSKQGIMAFSPVKHLERSSLSRVGQSPREVKLDLLPQLLLWRRSPCWDHLGARTWWFLTLTSVCVLRTWPETQCAKADSPVPAPACCTSATFTHEVPARERLVQTHLADHQAQSVALSPPLFWNSHPSVLILWGWVKGFPLNNHLPK